MYRTSGDMVVEAKESGWSDDMSRLFKMDLI